MKVVLSFSLILVLVVAGAAQRASELSGYLLYKDKSPAKGVVVSIGNFNVVTDANGYYKVTYLKPGLKVVSITPPNKATRSFKVMIGTKPTQKDFVVNW
ncbi:MAG: hypothetical protein DMF75_11045 [Acidobacteria bacterium]|nr:MAG: hypothetical protein DMF75_11045 [Acidobacteriota bacterium]